MKMSTKITDLRGAKVTPIHRSSALLSKQEDLCSTSYGNERWIVNQVPARITRRAGAPPSIFFAIFEILENVEISIKNVNFPKPLNPIELFPGILISLFD